MLQNLHNSLATGLAVLALLVGIPAHSQQHHGEPGSHHAKNLVAVFVGGAAEERRDTGAALGIEYERRLSSSWGLGLMAERTFGDFDFDVYAVSLAFHTGPWKTYMAPGVEDSEEGSENLVRVGVEYGLMVGDWEIAPQFDLDFIGSDRVAVLGVVFGFGF